MYCILWYNICLNTCKGEAIIYLYTIVGFVANGLVSFYLHARHISLNRYFTYLTSDHKIKTIPPFYPRRLVIHGWLSHLQSFRWWGEWCRSSYDMPLSCFSHVKEQKAEIAPSVCVQTMETVTCRRRSGDRILWEVKGQVHNPTHIPARTNMHTHTVSY